MGRRRVRRGRRSDLPVIAIAFGAGLLLALFCSVKFALIVAAVALIYIGVCCKPC